MLGFEFGKKNLYFYNGRYLESRAGLMGTSLN